MLTIVIPTRNRPHFLPRLLSYYREQSFAPTIVFADSSDSDSVDKNKEVIAGIGSTLKIEHRIYDPEESYVSKITDSLATIRTPFTALGADDDFFVPKGLERAVQFLMEQSDYVLAHGEAVAFELESGAVFGQITKVNPYNQRSIDEPTSTARLHDHFANYSTTYYSVHRTEQLYENFVKRIKTKTDLAFGELVPTGLSVIQGKVRKLDGLYMARQDFAAKEYEVMDVLDWIATPGWGEQYERFRDCLAAELHQRDQIELHEGRNLIKEVFARYLSTELMPVQNQRAPSDRLRRSLRTIPGARQVWRRLRPLNPKVNREINLPALLRSSSIYHAEFMPIYRAITTPPKDLRGALGGLSG